MHAHFECKAFQELSLSELYDIMVLRQEVFVVEQDCPYLDADGRDRPAWHLMGRNDAGRLLAYARLLPTGVSYEHYASIGRVITAQDTRRQGLGLQLMDEAIAACKQLFGETPLKISAQKYLQRFYEGYGFRRQGPEYLEDGIPHLGMVREV